MNKLTYTDKNFVFDDFIEGPFPGMTHYVSANVQHNIDKSEADMLIGYLEASHNGPIKADLPKGVTFAKVPTPREPTTIVEEKPDTNTIESIDSNGEKKADWKGYMHRRYMLTYKTHIYKPYLKQFIQNLAGKKSGDVRLLIAHEKGDKECNYEHTHVVVDFGSQRRSKDPRYFDYDNIHPHVSYIVCDAKNGSKNFYKALQYICKEDKDAKREKELLFKPMEQIVTSILEAPTLKDAIIENANSVNDVLGISRIRELRDDMPKRFHWKPHSPWQHQLITEFAVPGSEDWVDGISKPYNDRTITWIVGKKGGIGKTSISKWLCIRHPDDWRLTSDMGTSYHAATIIQGMKASGWTQHGLFINLTKSIEKQSQNRIYEYLEHIKDGHITVQKYAGKPIFYDDPHLIIFSNWFPRVNGVKKNRWDIREINEDLTFTYINQYELHKQQLEEQQYEGWGHAKQSTINDTYNAIPTIASIPLWAGNQSGAGTLTQGGSHPADAPSSSHSQAHSTQAVPRNINIYSSGTAGGTPGTTPRFELEDD